MRKTITFFDDFLKICAVSTLLLVIAGFIELTTYYSKFGVRISEFISTSEILLASFDRLGLVVFSLLIQMLLWLYLFNNLFDYNLQESLKDGERRPLKYHDETIHRFVKNKTIRIFFGLLFIAVIVTLVFYSINPQSAFWIFTKDLVLINYWIAMCLYLAWLQSTRKLWEIMKTNKEYNGKVILTILVFFTIFIATLWVKNSFQFNQIRKYGNPKPLQITLKDKTIIRQTDTIRFVGRTEKYFFYWDKITQQTNAYPLSEVIAIGIR